MERALAIPGNWYRQVGRELGIFLLALAGAILVRKVLSPGLEGRIVWVTFYPAVVVAGAFGGWRSGMLLAVFSCIVALYAWPWFVSAPFIRDSGDWLGLFAFLLNCILISGLAEMMRRAREHALESKAQAEAARQRADAASKAKSLFLANMSHELRTPMNAILGFTQLLNRESETTSLQRERLGIILSAGDHLLAIINDILDLAKIESGNLVVEKKEFDIAQLIDDLVLLLRLRAQGKGLHLHVDQSSSFPRIVRSDPAKVRQILINLVGNAIKFTDKGNVTIGLRAQGLRGTEPSALLHFEIEDTGCGIATEDMPRVFEPFVQLGSHEGTGLGLTITRQFVELLGGQISVHSQPGHGTKVRFSIGYEPVESEEGWIAPLELRPILAIPRAAGMRVLVADDSAENRLVVRGFLERFGFQIREVENGLECVEACRSWNPDMVLIDRRMPVMDGWTATRRIRELPNGRSFAILAVTAHAFQEEREEMMRAGCDGFLAKPYSEQDLIAQLVQHLRLDAVRQEPSDVPPPGLGELTPEMVNAIPAAQFEALCRALEGSDMGRIDGILASLMAGSPQLVGHLNFYTGRFDYAQLLELLKELRSKEGLL